MTEPGTDWKDGILDDFRCWIHACSQADTTGFEPSPSEPDLRDLYAEFAALRQELRLQNREQAKAGRELARAAERYDTAVESMTVHGRELTAFEQRATRAAENRCLRSMLDLYDVLARGLAAAEEVSKRRGFLVRYPRGIDGVAEGYGIALRRFDRMLSGFGVVRLETIGKLFDPRVMHAVEVRRVDNAPDGFVVEELQCGYIRDDEVLQLAEVIVNRL